MIVTLSLSRKITFQSCLPLAPWTCKGLFVWPHYDSCILQEHVSLVLFIYLLSPLNRMVRLALSRKIIFWSCLPLTPWGLNLQRSIYLASLWLVHPSRACFLEVIEPSEHDGNTLFVQKNHIPKLSTTDPLNLQRSICLASLWLVHPSRACFLSVIYFIEPSKQDGKTRFVQKNHIHILKLSTTDPLNLQRSICLASLWLVHPSRARFLSVIYLFYWALWTGS